MPDKPAAQYNVDDQGDAQVYFSGAAALKGGEDDVSV